MISYDFFFNNQWHATFRRVRRLVKNNDLTISTECRTWLFFSTKCRTAKCRIDQKSYATNCRIGEMVFDELSCTLSSPLKPMIRVEIILAEMVTMWLSTKIAQANFTSQKTWPPGGVAYCSYGNFENLPIWLIKIQNGHWWPSTKIAKKIIAEKRHG